MVTLSQNGSTSFTDPRISVSLSSGNGADNVTFAFNLSEYSCDLEGLYECQFQMENNFTTQFGNTSISFSGIPFNNILPIMYVLFRFCVHPYRHQRVLIVIEHKTHYPVRKIKSFISFVCRKRRLAGLGFLFVKIESYL